MKSNKDTLTKEDFTQLWNNWWKDIFLVEKKKKDQITKKQITFSKAFYESFILTSKQVNNTISEILLYNWVNSSRRFIIFVKKLFKDDLEWISSKEI